MATFPHPSTVLGPEFSTSTAEEPSTTTTSEHRYVGVVKTLHASPPSLTIIPNDRSRRGAGYERAAGISRAQLVAFLEYLSSGAGKPRVLWVSYVLRPGAGGVLRAQDVQRVEAGRVKKEEEEEEEDGAAWSASGPGEARVKEENDVSMIDRARGDLRRADRDG
ncbi:MAG: hypothetical protein Q9161_002572 [Pseudevernia consocians]